MDAYRRVLPGDKVRLSADLMNELSDTAVDRRRSRRVLSQTETTLPADYDVLVRNASGAVVDQYGVVGIGGPSVTPAGDGEDKWRNILIFDSDSPAAGARFGITQEPMPADSASFAPARLFGVTKCKLDLTTAGHRYADAEAGNYVNLVSQANSAPAEVIWVEPGGETTLDGGVDDVIATITVDATGPLAGLPYIVLVEDEQMRVTAVSGSDWTVTRGYGGTTPANHADGATVTYPDTGLRWAVVELVRPDDDITEIVDNLYVMVQEIVSNLFVTNQLTFPSYNVTNITQLLGVVTGPVYVNGTLYLLTPSTVSTICTNCGPTVIGPPGAGYPGGPGPIAQGGLGLGGSSSQSGSTIGPPTTPSSGLCLLCPDLPDQLNFSVSGITNGNCDNCPALNGTWTLTNSTPNTCVWYGDLIDWCPNGFQTFQANWEVALGGPIGGPYSWTLQGRVNGGLICTYQDNAVADCTALPITLPLTEVEGSGSCSGYPSAITLGGGGITPTPVAPGAENFNPCCSGSPGSSLPDNLSLTVRYSDDGGSTYTTIVPSLTMAHSSGVNGGQWSVGTHAAPAALGTGGAGIAATLGCVLSSMRISGILRGTTADKIFSATLGALPGGSMCGTDPGDGMSGTLSGVDGSYIGLPTGTDYTLAFVVTRP